MKIQGFNSYPNMISNLSEDMRQNNKVKEFNKILDNEIKNKLKSIKEDKKLRDACQQFESYFLNRLLKQMRSTVQQSDLMPKSQAENIFVGMLDEEYAKQATKRGGIGLADMIYKQLDEEKISTDKKS